MSLSAGARVGPYEVIHLLGAGGMGEVYRARDTRLGRFVALKTLKLPAGATPHQIERFRVEARAISRVSHPNICALHDIVDQDGQTFLVMELLDGETLGTRLEHGALPVERALMIAAQVADGLHAAHRHGVTHRDLTPNNIMLTRDGVKLLDFGLAKLTRVEPDPEAGTASVHLTEEGSVLGTLPYMAPEQVEGRDVDARTDIFSLGVVLFEMLTGHRPFNGSSRASLAAAILVHEPAAVSSLLEVPPALDRVARKCLAKDPEERWQTARDLASELRWIADSQTDPVATSPALSERSRLRSAARVAGLAALVGVALVTSGGTARVASGKLDANSPRWLPVTFRAGVVSAARFAPDGDTIIYSAAWEGQPYGLFITRRGTAESRPLGITPARLLAVSSSGELTFLRGIRPALNFLLPDVRIPATLVRVSLTGGAPRDILDHVIAADWTPRTGELVIVRRRGELQWPMGKVIHTSGAPITHLRASPDGSRVAAFQSGSVVTFDRAGTKATLSSGWVDPAGLAWSPDGTEVWFSAVRKTYVEPSVWAVSLSGTERLLLQAQPGIVAIHDVFADGRALLGRHHGRMGVSCHIAGDSAPRELAWLDGSAPEAIARDGSAVLLGEMLRGGNLEPGGPKAYLRPTNGSDAIKLADGFPEDLSPDGRFVVVVNREEAVHKLALVPVGPGQSRRLPADTLVRIASVNFLPDGKRLVFSGAEKGQWGAIYVQDLEGGSPRAISPDRVATEGHATPDGRFVVGQAADRFFLYPLDGGNPRPLPILTSNDMPLQFRHDGKLYVRRMDRWPPEVDLVDIDRGERQLWQTIFPADATGVDMILRIVITPDGASVLSRLRPVPFRPLRR